MVWFLQNWIGAFDKFVREAFGQVRGRIHNENTSLQSPSEMRVGVNHLSRVSAANRRAGREAVICIEKNIS